MFRIALGTQTLSNISERIWDALIIKIDINVGKCLWDGCLMGKMSGEDCPGGGGGGVGRVGERG